MIKVIRNGIILRPKNEKSQAKFNPGAILFNYKIHLLYRFCEKYPEWHDRTIDWTAFNRNPKPNTFPYSKNYICHAVLDKEFNLLEDEEKPVIYPDGELDQFGCEDPRIVFFEGNFLIFYCAFDGLIPKVGIAKTIDFKQFQKLGVIRHFAADKDAFIFPERIGGKIAFMHRIDGKIQIDYFNEIQEMFDPLNWLDYKSKIENSTVMSGIHYFETEKIGGGAPPLKTKDGWLIVYHGVDKKRKYHAAAALLDLDNPSRIISRIPSPLFSPETDYESLGDYTGCVFPTGIIEMNGCLNISYGAADKYSAIIKINLDEILEELNKNKIKNL